MAEMLDNMVSEYLTKKYEQARAEKLQARKLAREILIRMSDGEEFGIESFMFAASLGEPERYEQQAGMLREASHLSAGTTVAAAVKKRISYLGTTKDNPLRLRVHLFGGERDPGREQTNRRLRASILLSDVVAAGDEVYYPSFANVSEVNDPTRGHCFSGELLYASGEPSMESERSVFSIASELITGTEAIIDFINTNDDRQGAQQLASLTGRLARANLAYQSLPL